MAGMHAVWVASCDSWRRAQGRDVALVGVGTCWTLRSLAQGVAAYGLVWDTVLLPVHDQQVMQEQRALCKFQLLRFGVLLLMAE